MSQRRFPFAMHDDDHFIDWEKAAELDAEQRGDAHFHATPEEVRRDEALDDQSPWRDFMAGAVYRRSDYE